MSSLKYYTSLTQYNHRYCDYTPSLSRLKIKKHKKHLTMQFSYTPTLSEMQTLALHHISALPSVLFSLHLSMVSRLQSYVKVTFLH